MPAETDWPAGPWVIDTQETLIGASAALFDQDRRYRYALTRSWSSGPWACWLILNPSKANAMVNDPTVTRCVSRARRWGGSAAWSPSTSSRSGPPTQPPSSWRPLAGNERANPGDEWPAGTHDVMCRRVGKKAAGRELDGRTWDQMPEPAGAVVA
jgi:hypothetical protein